MAKDRLFFTVFGAADLGLLLYGLIALAAPTILLESFSRNIYQFPVSAGSAMGYFLALYRLLGFLNLLLGMAGLFLIYQFRRNSQDWVADLVMILTLLAYLGPIVFDNTVGEIGFFEILEHIIFVAMIAVAITKFRKLHLVRGQGRANS